MATKKAAKKAAPKTALSISYAFLLSSGNCIHRAGICAGAAVGAGVCINYENIVALADGLHRAGGFACAAGNAFA